MTTPLHRALPALASLVLSSTGWAQTPTPPPDDRGFSYFMGLGRHTLSYRESPATVPVTSHVKTSSPLLTTGALYALNADLLLSLDSETTFAPSSSTERWTATGPTVTLSNGQVVTLTDPVLQTNRFSLTQTTGRLLLQQRLHQQLFVFGGAAFHTHSFKRFGFVSGADNVVNLPPGTVDETVSEALLNLGLALESERVRNSTDHCTLRVGLGLPVWRRVQNTSFPNHQFNGIRGYNLSLMGRYSLALHPHVHLGGWGQLALGERSRQVQVGGELPRAEMRSLSYGLELLWKL